jgi:predicted Zn-dependent peptidase
MFEHYQLQNKANVFLIPLKDAQSITVLVMYPVGSRYEREKMAGVSHFIEHLMFKGTKKRKDTLTLTREIDRLGAEYNAFTGKEYTGYYIKTDKAFAATSLDILADMLFNSKFEAKEMEKEKGVIVEEIRMYKDNPLMNIDNVFEELMFDGSPLGRDIAGSEKHVRSYLRDDVLAYRDMYYHQSNMTIAVSGAIDEKTKELIEKYFGQDDTKKKADKKFAPALFGSYLKADRFSVQKKETDQAQLMMGFPGFAYGDERNPSAAVMNTILGGSMSSRLFIQIRERRGLAYMVRSGGESYRDTGYAFVRAGLEAKNINKAIEVTKQEIEKIIDKGVTDRELKDAKTHVRGSLALSLEDSSAQASWYAREFMFFDKIKTPEERLQEIEAVTHEDIKKVAKELFKWEKMRVAIIGNVSKEDVKF